MGQQANGTLRIVFDLPAKSEYKVSLSGKKLTVVIGDTKAVTPPTVKPEDPKIPEDEETPEEPEEPVIVEIDIEPTRSITIDAGHNNKDDTS